CVSSKAGAGCCSVRSSRAPKPRPTRCRATWARARRRAAYETDRLFYVAATRARQRLHLVAHVAVDAA
ncbi:hypothetical protein, partial [Bordetella pertussis]|uniref:hypothetical protein n=1 Tax=Bordetella pertussis TaxID=520 RepID=UPI003CC8C6C3